MDPHLLFNLNRKMAFTSFAQKMKVNAGLFSSLQAEGKLHPCDARERATELAFTDDSPEKKRHNQVALQQMEVMHAVKGTSDRFSRELGN